MKSGCTFDSRLRGHISLCGFFGQANVKTRSPCRSITHLRLRVLALGKVEPTGQCGSNETTIERRPVDANSLQRIAVAVTLLILCLLLVGHRGCHLRQITHRS